MADFQDDFLVDREAPVTRYHTPLCEEGKYYIQLFPRLFCHPFLLSLDYEAREATLSSSLAPVESFG